MSLATCEDPRAARSRPAIRSDAGELESPTIFRNLSRRQWSTVEEGVGAH